MDTNRLSDQRCDSIGIYQGTGKASVVKRPTSGFRMRLGVREQDDHWWSRSLKGVYVGGMPRGHVGSDWERGVTGL